jgi:hypothetical protein
MWKQIEMKCGHQRESNKIKNLGRMKNGRMVALIPKYYVVIVPSQKQEEGEKHDKYWQKGQKCARAFRH